MINKLLRSHYYDKSRNGKKKIANWGEQIQPKLATFKVLIEFAPSKIQTIFTVKRFSHLQMIIFGHFNFCENRRNGFRLNILSLCTFRYSCTGSVLHSTYMHPMTSDSDFKRECTIKRRLLYLIFQQHSFWNVCESLKLEFSSTLKPYLSSQSKLNTSLLKSFEDTVL